MIWQNVSIINIFFKYEKGVLAFETGIWKGGDWLSHRCKTQAFGPFHSLIKEVHSLLSNTKQTNKKSL